MTSTSGTSRIRRKGIILAGGTGSRLHPLTLAVSKQLLPVYDKPMIYYPLATLVAGGVTDVLIITTPDDRPAFERLLGGGSDWGLRLTYASQPAPNGIAEAFLIGEDFLQGEGCALVLGDNLFYGPDLDVSLRRAMEAPGATIFAQQVADPERYGVIGFGADGMAVEIIEKPTTPPSNWAVTGLYVFDDDVVEIARAIEPSARGELEISTVNQEYLDAGRLSVTRFGRGFAWLDTGTFDSLVQAGEYVRVIEQRQGQKIGAIEEVVWRAGLIDDRQLARLAEPLRKSGYGDYLLSLLR